MEGGDNTAAIDCRLIRVVGRVQGVGYRQACVRHARGLGITGWVRNRLDGSVEAVLQGSPNQIAHMCDWLRTGVPGARVSSLEVKDVPRPFDRFVDFERHPTV
ncbi:MAG: acylphosphatase [Variovorax sp.]|nr:acylphosphatase [Variovorax sp.]